MKPAMNSFICMLLCHVVRCDSLSLLQLHLHYTVVYPSLCKAPGYVVLQGSQPCLARQAPRLQALAASRALQQSGAGWLPHHLLPQQGLPSPRQRRPRKRDQVRPAADACACWSSTSWSSTSWAMCLLGRTCAHVLAGASQRIGLPAGVLLSATAGETAATVRISTHASRWEHMLAHPALLGIRPAELLPSCPMGAKVLKEVEPAGSKALGKMSSSGIHFPSTWPAVQLLYQCTVCITLLMAVTHVIMDLVCVVRPETLAAGTKMLEDLKKKGKVVTPKMEEMAKWMDSLDPGDAGGDVSWTILI